MIEIHIEEESGEMSIEHDIGFAAKVVVVVYNKESNRTFEKTILVDSYVLTRLAYLKPREGVKVE